MVCDQLSAEPKYKVSVLRCLRHELDGFQFGDDITTLHALVHDSDKGESLYRQLIDRYYGVRILDLSTTCLSVLGALMAAAGFLLSCVFTSLVVGLPAWFVGLIIGGVGVSLLLISLITGSLVSRKVTAWRQLADEYISLCSLRRVCDDSKYHMVNHYPPVCSPKATVDSQGTRRIFVDKPGGLPLGFTVPIPSFMLPEIQRALHVATPPRVKISTPSQTEITAPTPVGQAEEEQDSLSSKDGSEALS
ncbi:hypothetical protein [Chlamydiifrater phoenicopteri]|uniref:hypothetical protein n=1 Tax=Chlamydiifrater phoenicopteri TaxID=2681469 RepID=UPI001BCA6BD9|nr:hypothetical protein [Chlamydiifrater phoenicopteri]